MAWWPAWAPWRSAWCCSSGEGFPANGLSPLAAGTFRSIERSRAGPACRDAVNPSMGACPRHPCRRHPCKPAPPVPRHSSVHASRAMKRLKSEARAACVSRVRLESTKAACGYGPTLRMSGSALERAEHRRSGEGEEARVSERCEWRRPSARRRRTAVSAGDPAPRPAHRPAARSAHTGSCHRPARTPARPRAGTDASARSAHEAAC